MIHPEGGAKTQREDSEGGDMENGRLGGTRLRGRLTGEASKGGRGDTKGEG